MTIQTTHPMQPLDSPQPFLDSLWVRHWEQHFLPERSKILATDRKNGNCLVNLPLYLVRHRAGLLWWHSLKVVGSPQAGWVNVRGPKPHAHAEIVKAIGQASLTWDFAFINRIRGIQAVDLWSSAARDAGLKIRAYPQVALISTNRYDSGIAYLASRDKVFLGGVRRHSRRLQSEGQLRLELFGVGSARPCSDALGMIDQIVSHSWQGTKNTSIFSPANKKSRAFHHAILNSVSSEQYGPAVAVLLVNEEPVAYQYGFQSQDHYTNYAREYDQRFQKHSPGSVLNLLYLPTLFDANIKSVDFGVGDARDKRKWGDHMDMLYSVYLFHDGWRSKIYRIFHDLRKMGKRAYFLAKGRDLSPKNVKLQFAFVALPNLTGLL